MGNIDPSADRTMIIDLKCRYSSVFIVTFAAEIIDMDTLSAIQEPIKEELAELNRILANRLHTSSPLMNRIIDRYLQSKGKQIRPVLVLLCARMAGGISSVSIAAAAAIELMHNASLIHDDVVDNATFRRQQPTINAQEDNRIAVLVGDFFVSCALKCGVETGRMPIVAMMASLGQELAHGEIDQLDNARTHKLSETAYFEVIRRKTASLFKACMHVGAISADADDATRHRLETFGELLGLCFQIKDDVFDYYEDKTIGKPTGNDLREGKITLPLLYAITHNDDEENREMRQLLEKEQLSTTEIEQLIDYAKRKGGIEYANDYMHRLRAEATAQLADFPASETRTALLSILDYTIGRDK